VTNYLLGLSTKNVVTDPKGSPNKLLYVGGPTVSTLKVSPTPITGAAATVKERLKSTSATYFTGSVKMAADNSPVAGSVLVQYEAAGTTKFQTVATVKLAANGSFAGSVSQTKPGQWRAFYTGDGGLIGQSLGYSATPSSPIR
jgi:hypothetical protein